MKQLGYVFLFIFKAVFAEAISIALKANSESALFFLEVSSAHLTDIVSFKHVYPFLYPMLWSQI